MGWSRVKKARNVRPSFKFGQKIGTIISGVDQLILRGKAPWTIKHSEEDHLSLKNKNDVKNYHPKADGVITFDRLTMFHIHQLIMKKPTLSLKLNDSNCLFQII